MGTDECSKMIQPQVSVPRISNLQQDNAGSDLAISKSLGVECHAGR